MNISLPSRAIVIGGVRVGRAYEAHRMFTVALASLDEAGQGLLQLSSGTRARTVIFTRLCS
jgi:hypothetical protein